MAGVLGNVFTSSLTIPPLFLAGLVLKVLSEKWSLAVRSDWAALGCASRVRAKGPRVWRRQAPLGTLSARPELRTGRARRLLMLLPGATGGVTTEAVHAVGVIAGLTAGDAFPVGAAVMAAFAFCAATARLAPAL